MSGTARYVAGRVGQALLVLWVTYTLVFLAVQALPSDPVTIFLASDAGGDPALIAQVNAFYGYDRPWYVQYGSQLLHLLRGDVGFSLSTGQPVLERIGDVVGSTVALASTGLVLSVVIAVAVSAAVHLADAPRLSRFVRSTPSLFSAVPVFWLGIVVLQVFSFQLGILPLFPDGSLVSLLIPALVLAVPVSAPIAQVLLVSVEEAGEQPFVRTAKAKGLRPSRVFWAHVLRTSLPGAVAVIGTTLGVLVAGSVITETVFGRPGLGSVLLKAVVAQDVTLVQGLVLLTTAVVVLTALVLDLLAPVIDPRAARGASAKGAPRLAS
ncbi:ABC transporter permease [Quadrisphaera setariae]|uniref:ABC transporter permease n=1 Tax=Quadrisphaera setariae TaxID=2593304 RepID=A0A5C8Z445_9ACTN|nr:ABC transporter permease [Quadrisphaera setariae]TXR52862.1 ABC transporter permease [Quadrisphaera setariae]